jgi:phage-related protein
VKIAKQLVVMRLGFALCAEALAYLLERESAVGSRITLDCRCLQNYHVPSAMAGGKSKSFAISTNRTVMKPTVKITKGKDGYIEITALSEYCRQRGWRIIEETVTIEMPKGKELLQFKRDVQEGKVIIID